MTVKSLQEKVKGLEKIVGDLEKKMLQIRAQRENLAKSYKAQDNKLVQENFELFQRRKEAGGELKLAKEFLDEMEKKKK